MFIGLSKKLDSLSKEKFCGDVRDWHRSIVNHMYFVAATSNSPDETVAKWKSVANHVQNVHEHSSWQFPRCTHPEYTDDNQKNWLKPS
jgi:solute carrier family 8 (sodium/calcium exchanger)